MTSTIFEGEAGEDGAIHSVRSPGGARGCGHLDSFSSLFRERYVKPILFKAMGGVSLAG